MGQSLEVLSTKLSNRSQAVPIGRLNFTSGFTKDERPRRTGVVVNSPFFFFVLGSLQVVLSSRFAL